MSPLEAQRRMRRKLLAAARGGRAAALPPALFFTDPDRTPDPCAIATRLPPGWGVVYRHFGSASRHETARRLAGICRRRKLILLIGADLDLAREVGADGVHWPARLAPYARGRARAGLVTASAHSPRELAAVSRLGAHAAVLSTVFASSSSSAARPIGPVRFRILAARAGVLVYALGGVTAETASRVRPFPRRGVAGWAAVDGIAEAFG
jgi:thiamine-phosphate pyrophosphorylase